VTVPPVAANVLEICLHEPLEYPSTTLSVVFHLNIPLLGLAGLCAVVPEDNPIEFSLRITGIS
jgi:hypothetical protein